MNIDKKELRPLMAPSDLRAWWIVTVNFAIVAAAFALAAVWRHPLAWALASIVLAGRAQGFGVLAHDAAHLTFFTSRKLNEWAGKWLFASLPNLGFERYRKGHLEHHRTAGTERDPDVGFVDGYPATRASLLRKLLRDVSGINGAKNIIYQLRSFDAAGIPFLVAHALIFGALWAAGVPQVYACWWLGQLFVFPLLARLRVMSEHGGVPELLTEDPRRNTGTLLAGPLTRLLVTPNNVNWHVEHHFAASVPSYRLAQVHKLLRERGYYDGAPCIAPSLGAVIGRCLALDAASAARKKSGATRSIFDNMR